MVVTPPSDNPGVYIYICYIYKWAMDWEFVCIIHSVLRDRACMLSPEGIITTQHSMFAELLWTSMCDRAIKRTGLWRSGGTIEVCFAQVCVQVRVHEVMWVGATSGQ